MINRSGIPIKNQQKKKSRPSLLGRPFLWLLSIVLIFIGFGLLARIPGLQTEVSGYENIIVTETDDISISLAQYLDERFLYPKSNRLWFSERKAKEYIQQEFPRLAHVKVSSSRGSFSVYSEEREGFYLWCGKDVVRVSVDSLCYFTDDTGFIFDTAPYFSGTSYPRLYGGTVSEQIIGSQAYDQSILDLYKKFQETLEPFDLSIQGVYSPGEDQLEFVLFSNNEIPQAPRLKHYLLNNSELVMQNISFALKQDPVLLDITNNYDRLEYLDARFKNQVVYKFTTSRAMEETTYEKPIEQNNPEAIQAEEDIQDSREG